MAKNTFYVTTPIYYVTDKPHLGHLYSTVIADTLSRWNQLQGKETYLLTGTDEHGQKIEQAAHRAGKSPQKFVDSFIDAYKDTWNKYEIGYTTFIRTTDETHKKSVQKWLKKLLDTGDIYKDIYKGWYCTHCETFLTESEAGDFLKPLCPSCNRETNFVEEETYFFRLSKYQEKLMELYEYNPEFIMPKERRSEVVNFVKSGLRDLSISRTTVKWGIPFPDDDAHVAYVWADALCNYITAVGAFDKDKEHEFTKWWPADVHVMGKDIVRFHAIYWPAFLMASGLKVPKTLLVHGWFKVDKQKMSKSLGNVIDPNALYEAYGADPVRYYLLRQLAVTHDGEFSIPDLEQKISSELANDLGNLHNRVVTLAQKHGMTSVEPPEIWSQKALHLRDECLNMVSDYQSYMDEYLFHMALSRLWKFINQVNAYFHENEPWKIAQSNPGLFKEVISATAHSLQTIAALLWPVMPDKMEQLLVSFGIRLDWGNDIVENLKLGVWAKPFLLRKIEGTLFVKPISQEVSPEKEEQGHAIAEPEKAEAEYCTIEDVMKVQLNIGTILTCESVEKSDKLYKLSVDFGQDIGIRQILSGIKKHFAPEDLIGTQATFITNLKPRKMVGLESQGMMLFAQDEKDSLVAISPRTHVPNGARLQ